MPVLFSAIFSGEPCLRETVSAGPDYSSSFFRTMSVTIFGLALPWLAFMA